MVATTWNPADKNAAINLSNGNLTATSAAGSGSVNAAIRATTAIPAATKVYFEITFSSTASAQYYSVGVMNSAASLSANMAGSNGIAFINKFGGSNSYIYLNGAGISNNYPNLVNGQVIRVAVDRANNKIWWAINNQIWAGSAVWMGSGGGTDDPGTGVGGGNLAAVTGTIYPAMSSAWTSDVAIFNGGSLGFAYAIPAGFSALDGINPVIDVLNGDITPSVAFGADLTVASPINLAGDLSFAPFLHADESDILGFFGDLAPSVAFGADLTVTSPAANYVDLAGNLGGVSQYGRLKYGRGHYSRIDAFAPTFAAVALDIVGTAELAGNLAPSVTFAATTLMFVDELAGDLAPVVTFAADLGLIVGLAGDVAPVVDLAGDLTFDLTVQGDLPFVVIFAATTLTAGPLWATTDPCPTPPWAPTDPCPPTMWEPTEPCDPVEWEDAELCNG